MISINEFVSLLESTQTSDDRLRQILSEEKIGPADVKRLFQMIDRIRQGKGPTAGERIGKWGKNVIDKVRYGESYDIMLWNNKLNEGPLDYFGKKKNAKNSDDLMAMWQHAGRPTDIPEIHRLLKQAGYSGREINKAFKYIGVNKDEGTTPQITKLANAIKKKNLHPYVVDYLERMHNITESYLIERVIADKDIKQVLVKLANVEPGENSADAKQAANQKQANITGHGYINNWADDIKQIANEPTPDAQPLQKGKQKRASDGNIYTYNGNLWIKGKTGKGQTGKKAIQQELNSGHDQGQKDNARLAQAEKEGKVRDLVKEIMAALADRKGMPEWETMTRQVKGILKPLYNEYPEVADAIIKKIEAGATMESAYFAIASRLLEKLNLKWVDLNLKPLRLNENTVIFSSSRRISENHIDRFLNYLEPDKGLGRRRKP